MAMVNTPSDRALKSMLQSIIELGEIPPGFGTDQPGKFPFFGTSSWDAIKDQVAFKIREANKAGNTALYQIAKTNWEGLRGLREGLAARGILDSGEHNYQSAELSRQFANAQAAARSQALSSMQKGAQGSAMDTANAFAQQVNGLTQSMMAAAQNPGNWQVPYQNPFFGSPMTGGSVPSSIKNLFGG